MNLKQTSKMTGIPEVLLIRMRARETTSLKSGPPFQKKLTKKGNVKYEYRKVDIQAWLKLRRCLITAADAAKILDWPREEILKIYGVQSIEVVRKDSQGKLIINNGKNIYIWIPHQKKKKTA